MDFEELHGNGGAGTNVGVDLTTLMTSQIAMSSSAESSGGGGGGGSDLTVPRIASFQAYWDVRGKQFKVFNPKVVDPSGNEIAVTEPVLSRGTYVCEVKKNAVTKIYTAAIKSTDAIVPSSETVTVVKLFKIADGKVEQYHVGAIILSDSGGGSRKPNPAPFDISVTETEDPTTHEKTKSAAVVNCKFKFNGSDMELDDYAVPEGAESVWLVGVETGGVWEWRLDTEEQEETSQSAVYNLKLYDLDGTDVTMDYRTTFQTAVRGVWKLTGQEGATAGTTAEPLTGDVAVAGDAKSGLIVRTSRQGGMSIDIRGRAAADVFGVHNVTGSGGAVLAKILATADFATGGGGGTTGYTGTLTVATGRLRCNSESGYYIQNQVVDVTYADGLATDVSEPRWDTANGIPTTPLSEEA